MPDADGVTGDLTDDWLLMLIIHPVLDTHMT